MSSFLQSLGTRAIGRAAIVPRVAALFEPSAGAGVAALAPTDAAPSASVRVAPVAGGAPVRHGAVEAPRRDTPLPDRSEIVGPSSSRPPVPRPRDAELSVPATHTHMHHAVARDAETELRRAAASIDAPRSDSPLISVSVAPPVIVPPALVAAWPLPLPRAMATSAATHAAPTARTVDAPAPVRVTIGRVEVRAVFDPAPTRPAVRAASPPTPSLDEYLRKRGRR